MQRKYSIISLLLLLCSFLMIGCSSNPFASQARIYNDQFRSALLHSKQCEEDNASNPDVVLTYEQIMVKGMNPPNRSALLASDKKLNDQQKLAYQSFLKLDDICFESAMEKVKNNPYGNLLRSAEAMSAVNDSNLLNGKISIGEANAKKLEITQKLITDLTLLKQQLNNQDLQEQVAGSVAAQNAINNMNTATQIRQNQMTQQLLQQQNQNRFLGR
jgi:hypothetical protein